MNNRHEQVINEIISFKNKRYCPFTVHNYFLKDIELSQKELKMTPTDNNQQKSWKIYCHFMVIIEVKPTDNLINTLPRYFDHIARLQNEGFPLSTKLVHSI